MHTCHAGLVLMRIMSASVSTHIANFPGFFHMGRYVNVFTIVYRASNLISVVNVPDLMAALSTGPPTSGSKRCDAGMNSLATVDFV